MSQSPAEKQLLPRTTHFWPDPQFGPWTVTFNWQDVSGRAEVVGVTIDSARNPRGGKSPSWQPRPVTTAVLRELRIGQLMEEDRAGLVDLFPDDSPLYKAPPTMRPVTLARLKTAAKVYKKHIDTGKPTRAVARHFTISDSAAAKQVARAREIGLLPPTKKGVTAARASRDAK